MSKRVCLMTPEQKEPCLTTGEVKEPEYIITESQLQGIEWNGGSAAAYAMGITHDVRSRPLPSVLQQNWKQKPDKKYRCTAPRGHCMQYKQQGNMATGECKECGSLKVKK